MSTLVPPPSQSGTLGRIVDVGEHPEQQQAELTAPIPDWLSGVLLRNGPGCTQIGDDQYEHLFDGCALLQQWTIKQGKVLYRTRYLRSAAFERNTAANRIVVSEFGTAAHPDPCKTLFHRYLTYAFPLSEPMTDNALVNIIQSGDQVYAMTETPALCRIDPHSLDTLQNNLNVQRLVAVNTQTAHSHYTRDGHLINLGTGNGQYHVLRVDRPPPNAADNSFDHIRIAGSIKFEHALYPSYYHSFAITDDKIVFPEMPLRLSVPGMLGRMLTHQAFDKALSFSPNDKTRFHILQLDSGQPAECPVFTADAFFTFHHVNAFEADGQLVVDVCAYVNDDIFRALSLRQLKHEHPDKFVGAVAMPGELWRFVLPLHVPEGVQPGDDVPLGACARGARAVLQADRSVHCIPAKLCDKKFELPRINYAAHNGRPYRYVYGAHLCMDGSSDGLYKVDVSSGAVSVWQIDERKWLAGEPVFIARPGATDEDDGVVVAPVSCYVDDAQSFLVFLDARDFTEISRAHVKQTVPFGFHAHFVDDHNEEL